MDDDKGLIVEIAERIDFHLRKQREQNTAQPSRLNRLQM